MQRRQLDDGVDILKQLTADNAFVYGLVDVCKQHQLATILASGEPGCASNTSHSAHVSNRSTFLEEGMRRALLHLRQVAPPGNLRAEFGGYKGAVGKLFAGSHIDDSHSLLPEQLAQDFEDHYADAIHAIHGSLAGRSDDPGGELSLMAWCCCLVALLGVNQHGILAAVVVLCSTCDLRGCFS